MVPLTARRGSVGKQVEATREVPPARCSVLTAPVSIGAKEFAALAEADISTTFIGAPHDDRSHAGTAGVVVHNQRAVPVYATAGGPAIARLAPEQAGGNTWLPVMDQQPGWVRVLLPSQPTGATGWLTTRQLQLAHIPHDIRVHLRTGRLQLFTDGRLSGNWRLEADGAAAIPAGRTFLLGAAAGADRACAALLLTPSAHHGAVHPSCPDRMPPPARPRRHHHQPAAT